MTRSSVRTVTRLLVVALTCGVLAACGEDDEDTDPPREIVEIGGADRQILDTDYEARRFFSLTDPRQGATIVENVDLELFRSAREGDETRFVLEMTGTRHGDATNVLVREPVKRLFASDYGTLAGPPFAGTLVVLKTELPENERLYVAYRNANQTISEVGNFFNPPTLYTPLRAKLLAVTRADFEGDSMSEDWRREILRLERRQVYDLEVRDAYNVTFHLQIRRAGEATDVLLDGQPLLSVLGLDIINNRTGYDCDTNTLSLHGSDGVVDWDFIDGGLGRLYFPETQPFAPTLDDLSTTKHPACRPRALGWRLVEGRYEPLTPAEQAAETNPALYDRFRPTASDARYVITGQFEKFPRSN